MCIAILKPENETIDKTRLENSFANNDDGAGYMFAKDGVLNLFKGFFRFEDFWNSYKRNVIENGNPISAIHFRITTHGKTDKANCHPFRVNKKLGFIHNGVINMVKTDTEKSDTAMFNEIILKHLPKGFIRNQAITNLIEESIGNSKLVFLNNKGNYLISNESKGEWNKNVWYSNSSYQYCYYYYGNVTSYGRFGGHFGNNTKQKKKKKTKAIHLGSGMSGVTYSSCKLCRTPLITAHDQNSGYCNGCNGIDYSG